MCVLITVLAVTYVVQHYNPSQRSTRVVDSGLEWDEFSTDRIHSLFPQLFHEVPRAYLSNLSAHCWMAPPDAVHSASSSSRLRCLPPVYILGMPKCGTSELYTRLGRHPNVVQMVTSHRLISLILSSWSFLEPSIILSLTIIFT